MHCSKAESRPFGPNNQRDIKIAPGVKEALLNLFTQERVKMCLGAVNFAG
jgi:hypothetical protein